MNNEMIERIALEATQQFGFDIDDEFITLIKVIVERIDAERGKEAVGMVVDDFDGWTKVRMFKNKPSGTRLFLSPVIPEGMALVPIDPTEEMLCEGRRADAAWCEVETDINIFESGLVAIYKAMIAAAQGERK